MEVTELLLSRGTLYNRSHSNSIENNLDTDPEVAEFTKALSPAHVPLGPSALSRGARSFQVLLFER
jgi:hypothetical protein